MFQQQLDPGCVVFSVDVPDQGVGGVSTIALIHPHQGEIRVLHPQVGSDGAQ